MPSPTLPKSAKVELRIQSRERIGETEKIGAALLLGGKQGAKCISPPASLEQHGSMDSIKRSGLNGGRRLGGGRSGGASPPAFKLWWRFAPSRE